jgi:ribosomal protein S18 acetylase RimI-like enzyme
MIEYRTGNDLDLDQVIGVYRSSTLGARRPVDERERMGQMLRQANLVVTAWDGDRLVGIARSLSDFCWCTYLADLAVDVAYQRQGIGRELIERTRREGGRATVLLFAAPAAEPYYPRIGFRPGSGWMIGEKDPLR